MVRVHHNIRTLYRIETIHPREHNTVGSSRERLVSHTYETRWLRASGTRCTDRRYDVEGCRIECTRVA
eukprot:2405385-Prymnesium_polylepis.1